MGGDGGVDQVGHLPGRAAFGHAAGNGGGAVELRQADIGSDRVVQQADVVGVADQRLAVIPGGGGIIAVPRRRVGREIGAAVDVLRKSRAARHEQGEDQGEVAGGRGHVVGLLKRRAGS